MLDIESFIRTATIAVGACTCISVATPLSLDAATSSAPGRLAAYSLVDSTFPLDTAVRHGVLPNGFQYYIRENRKPEKRASLQLVVKAGSLNEDDDQRGLAHFVEHMAFNGTRNFEKNQLIDYLHSIGMRFGAHLNAYTSFDRTQYMLQVPTDDNKKLLQGLQIIEDWAHGITMDSSDIEAERGIIVEEWRMRDLGASGRVGNKHLPVMLEHSRYAERKPIGDMNIIRTAPSEALTRFYRDWYRPDLMAIVAVGDFDGAQVEQLIRKQFGAIPVPLVRRSAPTVTLHDRSAPAFSVVTDPELQNIGIGIMTREEQNPASTRAGLRTALVRRMLYTIMNDRLQEMTLRPGVPFLTAGFNETPLSRQIVLRYLSVVPRDTLVIASLQSAWTELERARRHGVTGNELDRVKTSIIRSAEISLREASNIRSDSYAGMYADHFMGVSAAQGLDDDVRISREIIETISPADLQQELEQWMSVRNRLISIDLPKLERIRPPDTTGILSIFDNVAKMTLEAYTEVERTSPIMETEPTPGKVIAERSRGAGVTEWTLSNGARVLLKPTKFKDDEVALVARSPGGYQSVADSDLVTAQVMSEFVGVGGIGKYSMPELRKRIAPYVFSLVGAVADGYEQVSGATTLRDMEVFFQFLHLAFTARRFDSVAMEARLENLKAAIANRDLAPGSVFQDTVTVVLAGHHPRVRPITVASLDSVHLRRAFQLYTERFANAGDFTFAFVGNFNPDSLRPLVERYVASLPATKERESYPKFAASPPRGTLRKTVRKGFDAQAYTVLVIHDTQPITLDASAEIGFLQPLLQMRLTRRLREELGGVYSVAVNVQTNPSHSTYNVSITFLSDPNRTDEMVAATRAVIDTLRMQGPTGEEVKQIQEQSLRSAEVARTENGFWLQNLLSFDQLGWDFSELLSDTRVRKLTRRNLHQIVKRYLGTDTFLHFELIPEI